MLQCNFLYKNERIGEVLQTLNGLKSLMNLNIFLARDLGLNLFSVLFVKENLLNLVLVCRNIYPLAFF